MATKVIRCSDDELQGKMEIISPEGNDASFDGDVKARGFALIGGEGNALIDDYGGSVSINTVKHYTGYCDTAGTVAQKDVSLDNNKGFSLTNGVKILIHLQYANTVESAITMQVDYLTVYKSVYYKNGTAVSGSLAAGIYELEYYNNAWYILNAETSSGGSNTDISYANSKISKTVNGVTSDVVTAADMVKDGLTVGSATGNGNVVSAITKDSSTGAIEVEKGISAVTDVSFNATTGKLVKSVGNTNTDIVEASNFTHVYGKAKEHPPLYIDHAADLAGSLSNLFTTNIAEYFSNETPNPEIDTFIITPFSESHATLDFSKLTSFLRSSNLEPSLNRFVIYIMHNKSMSTYAIGAVLNDPCSPTSGSSIAPANPGYVPDPSCKIECYFNSVFGYWFVDITSLVFIKGDEMSEDDYKHAININ